MARPSANEIRKRFIDYFVEKCGHTFVPSSPCVPHDDPTLMFTNAGMNQFKDVFLGTGTRPYRRAANSQKCIRAGGKHNDLEDVGHDTYHHTFFEMLGNWSFGDYFKKEAIAWAWDLLTNVWGLDKRRLHATYFEGDDSEGLEPDTEAADLWRSVTDIDPANIHPGNKKDNFWEMGDTGPCGPCSEIHIDLTPDLSGRPLVNAGDARVIEIWNLVFIQFNRGADGKLTPLPANHVDTGMGFERITAVLQGMAAGRLGRFGNYDTDLFTPIFGAIGEVTRAPAYAGRLETNDQSAVRNPQSRIDVMRDVAYRVIADHIRCLTFANTDGALPSNEGRGYVLRRILRRAVRYGRQFLDMHEPFLHKLVPVVAETMGGAFPELRTAYGGKNVERVAEIIRDEEASFGRTLDRGIALFEEAADYAVKHHHGRISGEDAFKLHDTYGFPIDLTELMAQERGLTVNIGEYERLMEDARQRARSSALVEYDDLAALSREIPGDWRPTDDEPKYETFDCMTKLEAWFFDGDAKRKECLEAGDLAGLVLRGTCFYAEQGGQVGDVGIIEADNGLFDVTSCRRIGDLVVHIGRVQRGIFTQGDVVWCKVDLAKRPATMKNHTATHIMNWALREVLGDHVQQKGSLVDPEKTRFDLSHPAPIKEDELARIEDLVNKQIQADMQVHTAEVDQAEARKINTLRAVFGEKYPDRVRLVSIGVPIGEEGSRDPKTLLGNPTNPEWMKYSVEFCGGTHLKRTGETKRFRLIEESAVAKGIRRVVGITGERATDAEARARALARLLAEAATVAEAALPNRIAEITAEMNQCELPVVERMRLRADLEHLQERAKKAQKAADISGKEEILEWVGSLMGERIGPVSNYAAEYPIASPDLLRIAADSIRSRDPDAVIFLASRFQDKVAILASTTPEAQKRGIKAGDMVKALAPVVGGKGGGRPDMAQGGGPDVDKIAAAVEAEKRWLAEHLKK